MITKERLEEIEKFLLSNFPHASSLPSIEIKGNDEGLEMIQLARLGIWAREYGIAAVHKGLENTNSDFCSHGNAPSCSWCQIFVDAIDALLEVEK